LSLFDICNKTFDIEGYFWHRDSVKYVLLVQLRLILPDEIMFTSGTLCSVAITPKTEKNIMLVKIDPNTSKQHAPRVDLGEIIEIARINITTLKSTILYMCL